MIIDNPVPSTRGDFGGPNAPPQCTAMSKRSRQRCRGPAVVGSATQKCRMHGGRPLTGADAPSFVHGRKSKYLPARLGELYREALSNPELLEMADHIALLEGRLNEILGQHTAGAPVPRWDEVAAAWKQAKADINSSDKARVKSALSTMDTMIGAGEALDETWQQVSGLLSQISKLTDTEVKRKKDLGQMVPVERVMVLIAAVSDAVKRNVKDPKQIEAVQRELASIAYGDTALTNPRMKRVGAGSSTIEGA